MDLCESKSVLAFAWDVSNIGTLYAVTGPKGRPSPRRRRWPTRETIVRVVAVVGGSKAHRPKGTRYIGVLGVARGHRCHNAGRTARGRVLSHIGPPRRVSVAGFRSRMLRTHTAPTNDTIGMHSQVRGFGGAPSRDTYGMQKNTILHVSQAQQAQPDVLQHV